MKLLDVLESDSISEANVAQKILKDPRQTKMLSIAWKHDHTLPPTVVARLGPKPTEQAVANAWSKLLDDTLRRNDFGDLSADGKFDEWLTRLYINGQADFEDINGEGGDALGAWKALSIRGKLLPQHQDFNKFNNIKQIQKIVRTPQYRQELDRIKDAEKIEKMKREKLDLVLIDDEKYYVIIPFNYGACYTFGNAEGYRPNFCTSSSNGARWFDNYAPNGPIISIVDKENMEIKDGKWQLHANTNQIVDADQTNRWDKDGNDKRFAELFPGLLKRIGDAILDNAEKIKEMSKPITRQVGYDVDKDVKELQTKFPQAWNSAKEEPAADEPEAAPANDGPGTYLVTQIASGRTARITAQSREDAQQQLLARHPTFDLNDYSFELIRDEQ
jgi:hypothetical protein